MTTISRKSAVTFTISSDKLFQSSVVLGEDRHLVVQGSVAWLVVGVGTGLYGVSSGPVGKFWMFDVAAEKSVYAYKICLKLYKSVLGICSCLQFKL